MDEEQQIIIDAIRKHGLDIPITEDMKAFVRYVRHVGYSKAFSDIRNLFGIEE